MYGYYMTMRPAGPGAQPRDGLVNIIDLNPDRIIPHIRRGAYARLEYDRPLTEKEQRDYEIIPDIGVDDVQYRGYVFEWDAIGRQWRIYHPAKPYSTIAYEDTLDAAKAGIDEYLAKPEKEG